MTVELTLQVPNRVARRLEPIRDRLPALLSQIAEARPPFSFPPVMTRPVNIPLAYAEVIEFLVSGPPPREITAFKVSEKAQARLRKLLDKNRESLLTSAEQAELDLYEQIEHVMILLKARAHASTA
ncbi:MAG: hypothetical protein ISS49_07320 [Anaerolineae bacterium]|nr:hypothetical protein [Anaerolineae bacterium]